MNGKKSKALRREAEQLTIGMPKIKYMPYPMPLLLAHACTRNIYKLLKGQGKINLGV